MIVNLFKSKKTKNNQSKTLMCINIEATKKLIFLTFCSKKVFNKLMQTFSKALILYQFDPKWYIRIENNILSLVLDYILRKLTLD